MIEFEVIQKIKIKPIPETVIRELVLAELQKQVPEAHINGMEFIMKRNPTRIEVEVDAQYGKPEPEDIKPTPRGGMELPPLSQQAIIGLDPMHAAVDEAMIKAANAVAELVDPKDKLIEEVIGKPEPVKEVAESVDPAGDVAKIFTL